MRGVKSALVWYHTEMDTTIEPECDKALEKILQGYKRKVAELKAAGKMKIALTYTVGESS